MLASFHGAVRSCGRVRRECPSEFVALSMKAIETLCGMDHCCRGRCIVCTHSLTQVNKYCFSFALCKRNANANGEVSPRN